MTMPVTDDHAILAKVRKLLALAEDPAATAQEAETYTDKATQLIADYGIDQALLAAADPDRDRVGDLELDIDAPYAADKADLLSTIAGHLRCRAVSRTRHTGAGKERSMHLFGHASDLERTELLYTSLLLQSASGLTRTPVPTGEHTAAFRRSWLAGFRMSIGNRLAEAEARAETAAEPRFTAAGRSSSIVLADRSAEVESTMHAAYPRLATARPRSLSGSGVADGWAAGQRADLGRSSGREDDEGPPPAQVTGLRLTAVELGPDDQALSSSVVVSSAGASSATGASSAKRSTRATPPRPSRSAAPRQRSPRQGPGAAAGAAFLVAFGAAGL